jgi:RNA-directed DNA polymerase
VREKIHDLTSARFCFAPITEVVCNVNAVLRGWLAYFSKGHPANARYNLIRFAELRLVGHLRRRSQRPYRPPDGVSFYQHIHDLGLMPLVEGRG